MIALILLLLVTLVALSSARLAMQGQRAVVAECDREVALRAAEAALDDAWRTLSMPSAATSLVTDLITMNERERWLEIDLIRDAGPHTTAFGAYTGRYFAYGAGLLPQRLPRYLIERLQVAPAAPGVAAASVWRVTAVGFGAQDDVHVVLQALYRRTTQSDPIQQISWRDIANWDELHTRASGSDT
ncbi:MAG: pilus assembly protein [Pseudomonadota bacterium]|nr:pilus assembly protein [Pseudomonadota bacterium]